MLFNQGRRRQVGALPYRVRGDGELEVLLITSRQTRRWLVPKGNLMAGKSWRQAAAQEAFEEAGALGEIGTREIGEYRYRKVTGPGRTRRCVVAVYPLLVSQQAEDWPERSQRDTRWVTLAEAGQMITEVGLRRLVMRFIPGR